MEATLTISSTRETVMLYLWEKIFDYFEAEDYKKAETTFCYYTRLEEISDTEYEDLCQCDKEGCHCRL